MSREHECVWSPAYYDQVVGFPTIECVRCEKLRRGGEVAPIGLTMECTQDLCVCGCKRTAHLWLEGACHICNCQTFVWEGRDE